MTSTLPSVTSDAPRGGPVTLVSTADLLADAYARGTGLAALNVITLEHAEGTVLGAEQAGLPVVLQVSQNAAKFHLGRPGPARRRARRARPDQPGRRRRCTSTTSRGSTCCTGRRSAGSAR